MNLKDQGHMARASLIALQILLMVFLGFMVTSVGLFMHDFGRFPHDSVELTNWVFDLG